MLEHLEQLDLNTDYDCNDFGLASDCYRQTPRPRAYRTLPRGHARIGHSRGRALPA